MRRLRQTSQMWLAVLAMLALAFSAVSQTTTVWTDNFESPSVWDNWSVDNGVWEIGAPTTGPATNSAGYRTHEGANCAATVLAGDYPANISSRLIRVTPFVVPSAAQNPRLEFWHWYEFSGGSFGVVQIKYGTNNWTDISPRYYANSIMWTRPVVDLKAYAGKAVQIAFLIDSDGSVDDGWDIDEVRVVKGNYSIGFTNNAAEGFELGLGDWSSETGIWEVGVPTSGPTTNALGWRAYAGTNCAATVLDGNYTEDRSSRLVSPPFVVPTDNPRLRFWHWFSIGAHDFCQVQIKVGTNSWVNLGAQYTGACGVWSRPSLDLSAYVGSTVQVAFYLESHNDFFGSSVGPGWYVDEVMVLSGGPSFSNPDGFEQGMGDWASERGTWEVGVPTYGPPTNALGQRAYTGTNCAATVLGGNYPSSANSRLISPAFVVPATNTNPRLHFWHWYNFSGGSYGVVEIKVGTNAWREVSPHYTADSIVWTRPVVELAQYAGQSVQVGFHIVSDGNVDPGWYVDDFKVVTGSYQSLSSNVIEGFEGGLQDWFAETGIWEIGVPTSGPPTNAAGWRAHEPTNCAATVLAGNYTEDRSSRLISPPFVVPAVGQHPTLRFWHWFSIGAHDFCRVQIKAGTNSWVNLSSQYTGNSGVWSRPSLDLSAYAGSTVQLAFYLESHNDFFGSSVGPGWYVDEVVITAVNPPTGIVEFTDARYFVNEGGGSATISVARKYGGAGAVDVTFMATDGTAVAPDDFESAVETLSWADGEQGVKTTTVQINQDALAEGNETVTLELIVPGSLASSVARVNATLVIVDDDGVPPLSTNIAYLRSLVVTTNYVATNTTSLFTVEGTVTTHANLSTVATNEQFFMQDNTNGIAVWWRGGSNQFMPQAGDRLRVTAALTNLNGLLALAPNYANISNYVWPLSSGNALPAPAALDFASRTNVPVMEATEARYMSAAQVWINQAGGNTFPTVLTNLVMTNQSGQTFSLTIHPNTDLAGKPKPAGPVTILGVLNQNDTTAPYTTNYALLPTRYADILNSSGEIQFVGANYAVLESVPSVILSVSRTGASNGPVTASFSIGGGTATAGADFASTNGILSWADGESGIKTFALQLLDDTLEEPDEWLLVNLDTIAPGSNMTAVVTIVNDDFVAWPERQVVLPGADVTVNVTPTASTMGFQWWKDGQVKANATNATLTVTNVQPSDQTNYWAVITTSAGAVTSTVAQVVIAVPVTITNHPQSQTAAEGSQVALCVGVSGTEPFTYQWRRNGLPLAGGTNACLVLNNVLTTHSGDYSVVVNNGAGVPATSSNATLVVIGGGFVPREAGLGGYTNDGGCYVVWGSGEDIEGTEDRFFFVNTEWSGDGQIVANMAGMIPENPLSEAGLMVRDGFTGGDRHVFVAVNAQDRLTFRRRPVANYSSIENNAVRTNIAWLRLMRMDDTFVGHCSTNGTDWQLAWWTTMADMPATLQWGLAVTARRHTGLATNTFCGVSVGGVTPIPGQWPEPGPRIHLGGGFCKEICVNGFLFWFNCPNFPSFRFEIKRAGGEL